MLETPRSMCDRPFAVDVLTDLLQRSRARGAAFSQSTMHGAWGVRFPGTASLAIHSILDGEMYGWVKDPAQAQRLVGGDVILVKRGEHQIAHTAGASCRPWSEYGVAGRRLVVGDPCDGPPAVFFCGAFLFDGDLAAPLLDGLPDLIRLRPAAGSALRVTLDLLAAETAGDGPGQQALLDRLLDVALVQALRAHLLDAGAEAPGWFRAMDDPSLAEALRAIHDDPAHPWTVGELASHAHLSRTAFARRFSDVLAQPPLQYVTDWRMALAKERLRDSEEGLARIASAVGYGSEFSFAAAFKRHAGVAPGRWRAAVRTAAVPG
jgi:AraC-like DNA-binding protein